MKKILLSSILIFALWGCQSGREIKEQDVAMIYKGYTSENQIRATFGEPDNVYMNSSDGIKILNYQHQSSDEIKRPIVGLIGAVAGGYLGNTIGDGGGRAIATGVGSIIGGNLAANTITTREKRKNLEIHIDMRTGRVVDFNYTESGSKDSPWLPSAGVGSL